jgi:integrase/recombinase XerD
VQKAKQESRAFKLFRNSIHSENTLNRYVYGLNKFCEYSSLTYDDLIKLDTEDLQIKLEDWVMSMSEADLRQSSIRTPLAAVEKFLEINRKLFYKKPLHALIKQDKDIGGGSEPFTNEDINKMLTDTRARFKHRAKAVIHFLASTGVRPRALIDPILRKQHLVEMAHHCYAIRVYDKSKEGYWAFLTPEARKALDAYLDSRKRNGERITNESILFVNHSKGKKVKHIHLTLQSTYDMLGDLYRQAGIEREKTGHRYNKALTYGFRKRFNTILKLNNDVNSNIAEKLMAHKNGLDGTYLTPTREECFAEFVKAIPNLTIDDNERLRVENQIKTKKIEQYEADKQRLDALETVVKNMKDEGTFWVTLEDIIEGTKPEDRDKQRVLFEHLKKMLNSEV